MEKQLEPPRFLPNDTVFGISDSVGWNGFNMIGYYHISKVEIVPKCFIYNQLTGKHEPTEEKRYIYYGAHFAGNLELSHVFKDKNEFIKFITEFEFPLKSPKK